MKKPLPLRSETSVLRCLFWMAISLSAFHTPAHDDPNADVPSVEALQVDTEMQVDGVLDEPFWQEADIATDFIDERTHEVAPLRTVTRIAYTKRHLYVSVECFDDKIDEIRATERREDRFFRGDDFVEVQFDPFHDHRSKYAFFSNPLGTKLDAKSGAAPGSFNTGWSAEWDLAAKIHEDRWTVEMRIPFGIMNYYRGDDQTWGLNITRIVRRIDSESFWSFNPTESYEPRYFGHLTGLNLAETKFDRNWEISPYASSQYSFNGDSDFTAETGGDISFRLSPSIVTAWAINPDFGQVEADADTIELRDTERLLPEKRPFFREGEELLRMRNRLYYSRRFTDIQTAARINGKHGDYAFAFLNIDSEIHHDDTRKGNSSVFRVVQEVGQKSNIGYYAAASEFEDGFSRVASTDGKFYLNDDYNIRFQGSVADDRDEDKFGMPTKDSTDYLGYTSLDYEKYPWDVSLRYKAITDEFNPMLGYIPRRNIFGPELRTWYRHEAEDRWYKEFDTFAEVELYENEDSETTLRDYRLWQEVVFPNDFGVFVSREDEYHAPYNNDRVSAGVVFHESDYWRSTELEYARGEFEETAYDEFVLEKQVKVVERLPLRHELVTRFEEEKDGEENTALLNRIVFDYFFTDEMWVKTSLQHRDEGIHNISVIFGWEFVENAHWYLVYNSVSEEDEETMRGVFTKIVYTF